MTQKIYAKPPKTIFIAQVIIISLFMIFGLVLFSLADPLCQGSCPYVSG